MKIALLISVLLVAGCSMSSADTPKKVDLTDGERSAVLALGDEQEAINADQIKLQNRQNELRSKINALAFRLRRAHGLEENTPYSLDTTTGELTRR